MNIRTLLLSLLLLVSSAQGVAGSEPLSEDYQQVAVATQAQELNEHVEFLVLDAEIPELSLAGLVTPFDFYSEKYRFRQSQYLLRSRVETSLMQRKSLQPLPYLAVLAKTQNYNLGSKQDEDSAALI